MNYLINGIVIMWESCKVVRPTELGILILLLPKSLFLMHKVHSHPKAEKPHHVWSTVVFL